MHTEAAPRCGCAAKVNICLASRENYWLFMTFLSITFSGRQTNIDFRSAAAVWRSLSVHWPLSGPGSEKFARPWYSHTRFLYPSTTDLTIQYSHWLPLSCHLYHTFNRYVSVWLNTLQEIQGGPKKRRGGSTYTRLALYSRIYGD